MPESNRRSHVRRLLLPTGVSLAIHVALLILIATLTWTIVLDTPDPPSRGDVLLTFDDPASPPPKPDPPAPRPTGPGTLPPDTSAFESARATLSAQRSTPPPTRPSARPPALTPRARAVPVPTSPSRRGISFAGVRADRAASVVYAVDASGAMASSFSLIVDELERSLSRLDPRQPFQVVIFRDRSLLEGAQTPKAALVLDTPGLVPATREHRARVIDRLRNDTIPSGRSDPAPALELALSLRPDAIFLLTRSIQRTGPGQDLDAPAQDPPPPWSIAWRDDLLSRLDALNPRRGGLRATTIVAIQFIDDDPTGTLQAIAREHAGPDGYVVRTREDFEALARQPAPAIDIVDASIERARAHLDALAQTGEDWRALFAMSTPADLARVRDAADRAWRDLGPPDALRDPLALLLHARASILLGVSDPGQRERALRLARDALARVPRDDPALDAHRRNLEALALLLSPAGTRAPPPPISSFPDDAQRVEHAFLLLRTSPGPDLSIRSASLLSLLDRTYPNDSALRVLARECAALRAMELENPRPDLAAMEILALRADLAGDAGLSAADIEAIVMDRMSRLVDGLPASSLTSLPAEAALAWTRSPAARALVNGRAPAEDALRSLMLRDDADHLLAHVFRALADLLASDANIHRRIEGVGLLMTLATHFPESPESDRAAETALTRALELVDLATTPESRAIALNALHQALREARALASLSNRDQWRALHDATLLELATFRNSVYSLHLLEEIRPGAPEALRAVELYQPIVRAAIRENLDLHRRTRGVPGAEEAAEASLKAAHTLALNALAFYDAHAMGALATQERALLAQTLELMGDLPRARETWRSVLREPHPFEGGRPLALLRLGVIERALGDDASAFSRLRDAVAGINSTEPAFWEAWATLLEILADQNKAGDRDGSILAQIARLRTIDPDLGSSPWRERILAVLRDAADEP